MTGDNVQSIVCNTEMAAPGDQHRSHYRGLRSPLQHPLVASGGGNDVIGKVHAPPATRRAKKYRELSGRMMSKKMSEILVLKSEPARQNREE
ncbi:hypothetical protein C0J52_04226 [Blattella germanica]|nr:hypothetical protein C0J52_04226 [Blattella germanica]